MLAAIHSLALRGNKPTLGTATEQAQEAGLVTETKAGWMLTAEGHAFHDKFAAAERQGLDTDALRSCYGRFLTVNDTFKTLALEWHDADKERRYELLGQLEQLIERIGPILRKTAAILPRCAAYGPRLTAALEQAFAGDHDYAVSPKVDSVHTVWMELHEDLLQLQGITREEEGSY